MKVDKMFQNEMRCRTRKEQRGGKDNEESEKQEQSNIEKYAVMDERKTDGRRNGTKETERRINNVGTE